MLEKDLTYNECVADDESAILEHRQKMLKISEAIQDLDSQITNLEMALNIGDRQGLAQADQFRGGMWVIVQEDGRARGVVGRI